MDQYIQEAKLPEFDGEVVAIVAPHAGQLYSDPVAGYAFAALRGTGGKRFIYDGENHPRLSCVNAADPPEPVAEGHAHQNSN